MGLTANNNGSEGSGVTSSGPVAVRPRRLFLLVAICTGSLLLLCVSNGSELILSESQEHARSRRHYEGYHDSFTIVTDGCTIPAMRPLDQSIKKFVKYPKNMVPCHNQNITLLQSNRTTIWINKKNLHHYNITDEKSLICCYRSFYRPTSIKDITSSRIDDRVRYEECLNFTDAIEVDDEFVRVICYDIDVKVYEQFYLFAPEKELPPRDESMEISVDKSQYNVIVMGIDAVSRLNFHRTMPKTLAFLKNKSAVELFGYNKVGDNTFPNLVPMLLGIAETELKTTCLPNKKSTFDNCPFICEWFKQAGYYTALGEDSANLGTFNYVKVGFSRSPTDYYIHTFIKEAEKYAGSNKDFNCYLCMNDKYFFQVLLDYIENLTSTLKSSRLFGFFWEMTMSHDYLNYPMVMDEAYTTFFERLDDSNYLDNTILLLVSDHGIRWGEIRGTKQGRLEERLPFVFVLVPPSFRKKFSTAYVNLKLNSFRLTTPFDIYATLSDLVDINNIRDEIILTRQSEYYAEKRSISLFLSIPTNRTCRTAKIDDHWCTCHRSEKISTTSIEAVDASEYLIMYLNTMMIAYKQCARLTLKEVVEATEMKTGTPIENEEGWREFTVVVRAAPGGGVFEGTLRHEGSAWALSGTVSRLNLYGDQSRCVHDTQLKLYCYCL